jgi:hypothetical protein
LLAAPAILILNLLLWQTPRASILSGTIILILSVAGVAMMLGLSGCGVVFGWKGRRTSPVALAGMLVGMAAAIGWVMVAIQIVMILN